jgi:hypothetical protein
VLPCSLVQPPRLQAPPCPKSDCTHVGAHRHVCITHIAGHRMGGSRPPYNWYAVCPRWLLAQFAWLYAGVCRGDAVRRPGAIVHDGPT